MTRTLAILALAALLAACGADGAPEPKGFETGGTARIGVTGKL